MKSSSLFWNQLKWDLRFVWWALLAMMLLAPVQIGMDVRELRAADDEQMMGLTSSLLWFLMILTSTVGVVLAIQKDVPFGNREFWLSRPVGRGAVLGAKLALLGIFLGGLILTSMVTPFLMGARWGLFGLSNLILWGWVLVFAAVIASLSSNLGRVLIYGVGFGAVFVGALMVKGLVAPSNFQIRGVDEFLQMGWLGLILLMAFLLGIGLVCWQYLTRRSHWGAALFALLLATTAWAMTEEREFGGFAHFAQTTEFGEWEEIGLGVEWEQVEDGEGPEGQVITERNGKSYISLLCSGTFEGLSERVFVRNTLCRGQLFTDGKLIAEGGSTWGGGSSARRLPGQLEGLKGLNSSTPRSSGLGDRGGVSLNRLPGIERRKLNLFELPEDLLGSWSGTKLSYRGEVRVYVDELVRLASHPFGSDFTVENQGTIISVTGGTYDLNSTAIILDVTRIHIFAFPFERSSSEDEAQVFLVNRKRGQFLAVESSGARSSYSSFRRDSRSERYELRDKRSFFSTDQEWELWLEESEIEIYEPIQRGSFVRQIDLEEIAVEKVLGSLVK